MRGVSPGKVSTLRSRRGRLSCYVLLTQPRHAASEVTVICIQPSLVHTCPLAPPLVLHLVPTYDSTRAHKWVLKGWGGRLELGRGRRTTPARRKRRAASRSTSFPEHHPVVNSTYLSPFGPIQALRSDTGCCPVATHIQSPWHSGAVHMQQYTASACCSAAPLCGQNGRKYSTLSMTASMSFRQRNVRPAWAHRR